ncbi:unnamed protein product, partial [Mesorhabditis belari]|uniref:C3H1-type domain-containing protein n=1 Tax=Mesorhabditis belari TaxID=2138241 RepID=A0AAF3FL02_9BILA
MVYGDVRETGEKPRLIFANIPVAKLGFATETDPPKTILERLLNDVYEISDVEYTVNSISCKFDKNTGLAKITTHFSQQVAKRLLNTQGSRKLLKYNKEHNFGIKVYSQQMCEFFYYLGRCPFYNGCSFSHEHEKLPPTKNITCGMCFLEKANVAHAVVVFPNGLY